jgi:hypothetical protein
MQKPRVEVCHPHGPVDWPLDGGVGSVRFSKGSTRPSHENSDVLVGQKLPHGGVCPDRVDLVLCCEVRCVLREQIVARETEFQRRRLRFSSLSK